MTIVLTIGFCIETAVIIWLAHKANKNEKGIFEMDFQLCKLRAEIKGKEEAVGVLSDSVRKLNGVVKDLEQKQPKVGPKNRMNTRAFIAGWDADDPEPLPQLISKEEWMQMVKAYLNCQSIELNCQSIEPLPQQCIYPWQQTPSGAMLPLWYINSRLGEGVNYVKS